MHLNPTMAAISIAVLILVIVILVVRNLPLLVLFPFILLGGVMVAASYIALVWDAPDKLPIMGIGVLSTIVACLGAVQYTGHVYRDNS